MPQNKSQTWEERLSQLVPKTLQDRPPQYIELGVVKNFITQELLLKDQEARKDERERLAKEELLILETLLEAVKGADQRFLEEQGLFLDNRQEHFGAIKVLEELINGIDEPLTKLENK